MRQHWVSTKSGKFGPRKGRTSPGSASKTPIAAILSVFDDLDSAVEQGIGSVKSLLNLGLAPQSEWFIMPILALWFGHTFPWSVRKTDDVTGFVLGRQRSAFRPGIGAY
jgi:hypothetical protein